MAINLTGFSNILQGNTLESGDAMQETRTLDSAKPAVGFARVLKGRSAILDNSVAAFSGSTAFQTRRRGLRLW